MEIFYASSYTRPERVSQKLSTFLLSLIVSGFDYMRLYDRTGKKLKMSLPVERNHFPPFLALFPPGNTLKFSAGQKRENWAVILSLPEVTEKEEGLEYLYESTSMQGVLTLDPVKLPSLREQFSLLSECVASGHTAGMTKAKLLCSSILGELIVLPQDRETAGKNTPEAALKHALEQDLHFEYTIGELNRKLNLCSLPHMRKRFLARYGVLPCKYRNNLRMNRILELFSQSDLSLKMIADEVGMLHLEHLYTFLQSRQELSPKELMELLRGEKSSGGKIPER